MNTAEVPGSLGWYYYQHDKAITTAHISMSAHPPHTVHDCNMDLLILTLLSVALVAAAEPEPDKKAADVATDESGNRYGIYETNYRGSGYAGRLVKERVRYPVVEEYGYGIGPEIRPQQNREKVEEIVAYDPNYQKDQAYPIIEEVLGYRDQNGYEGYADYYQAGYRSRYPDYQYRRYGREGLGFDRRTAYALGLRYPLTPKLLQTVYRHNYDQNSQDQRHVL